MQQVTQVLGIQHPVVLGPFGGLSSASLVAAVSECGGLGSYGLYGYDPARIAQTARDLRQRTAKPFALNLWLATGDEVTPGQVDIGPAATAMASLFAAVGVEAPEPPERFLPDVDAQLDAALQARPAVLSLVYGVPPAWVVERARAQGTRVLGTATTVTEALALEDSGVDVIVASGAEAAGHRVSFLADAERSLVGTVALVPEVADAVRVPVLAAGGIGDRRGVAAAFALGAQGVVVGTAFLVSTQSAAPPSYREAILLARGHDTVLTRAMSGRLSRGLPQRAVRDIEGTGAILPFPAQNWLTGAFRRAASAQDRAELMSLWVGQGAPMVREASAQQVFAELLEGVPDGASGN